jgi:hypothetical protein
MQVIMAFLVGVIFYYVFEWFLKVCEESIPHYDEDYDVN